jgi:hypothetical protein
MRRLLAILLFVFALVSVARGQLAMVPGDRFRSWTKAGVNLQEFDAYYVVKEIEDEIGIDTFIIDALLQLDLHASSGDAEDMPAETQVKVTYESLYGESRRRAGVTDLVMFFREPSSNELIALVEMEKVQNFSGPDMITSAVHYLVGKTVELVEVPVPSSDLTKPYNARKREPEGSIPELTARGEFRIVNAQAPLRWPIIYPMRMIAKKEYVDYRQLLQVATDALEQHIRDAGGVIVTEGGDKTITLAITDFSNIAIFETFINFTLETGDGYFRGLQAYGKNWNYRRSIDNAVADIPIQVLNDATVISYLEQ